MRHCDNPNAIIQKKIDYDVREMLYQIAARGVVSHRPAFRKVADRFDGGLHFAGKIKSESGTFVFVIRYCLTEFCLGFAEDDDRSHCR